MTGVRIPPAARPLDGEVRVPGDKSIGHRALLLGSMADGRTEIRGLPEGADVAATADAVVALGATVTRAAGDVAVEGAGLELAAGRSVSIDCRNSGTTMRMLAGLVAGRPCAITLRGDASLSRRPMERVARPLRAMGAAVETTDGHPPIVVRGGALRPITWTPEVASAQVKSAILLAGLRTAGTTLVEDPGRTRDHTERLLAHFGAAVDRQDGRVAVTGERRLRGAAVSVPGDPSSAAYWMVAASVVPGSRVIVRDVCVNDTRVGLLAILRRMGADVVLHDVRERAGEPWADIEIRAAQLRGTTVRPDEVPAAIDELPVLAVAAACAEGETIVGGAAELRAKESDRLAALEQLRGLGVDISVLADGFTVRGRPAAPLTGGRAQAHGDHRVAMSLAVAGLVSGGGIEIDDAEVVGVSYPGFFRDLARLGGASERCPGA